MYGRPEVTELLGQTITAIEGKRGDEEMTFTLQSGRVFRMYHQSDCCESVNIEDVAGDLQDLLNSPLLQAECVTSKENPPGVKPEYQDSFTWTFYKFATIKGYVTIRWYGESNGYYSEDVATEWVGEKS